MSTRMEEITAKYLGERHRFPGADGDTIIATAWANSDINGEVTIKGQADHGELLIEQEYRFYGRWTNYKNKRTGCNDRQFQFQSFVIQQPHSRAGIITWLKEAGEGHGIGHARAAKLFDLCGQQAIETLRERPTEAADLLTAAGLRTTAEQCEFAAVWLKQQQRLEACTLDLTDILTGRGFPKTTIRLAVREWGNHAGRIIRRDPYKLMRFRGCGFKRCDAMYLDLKLPPGRLKRQALAAWHQIAKDGEGNTWYPIELAEQGIRQNIASAKIDVLRARRLARVAGATAELRTAGANGVLSPTGNREWIAEGRKASNESELAELIAEAAAEPSSWPDAASVADVTDHQREQLAKSLAGTVGILGGGPGCGKTYLAARLTSMLAGTVGIDQIVCGAPTGKAAQRLTETMVGYGLPLRARTWHSILRGAPGQGFLYGNDLKLPFKVLIGDESSMVDTDLMASVFRARARGAHFLLIGDVYQLPPVGHGAPLRDLINAGLPYGELREIMRNSGGIVEACAAIRDSKPWQPGDNLQLLECWSPEKQIDAMHRAIAEAAASGLDPIWSCQVLVPVNKKSPLARVELNRLLQMTLNPRPPVAGCPFRVGDKIVNTKNGFFPVVELGDLDDSEEPQTNDRGEVYVANGELAEVLEVAESMTIARLSNPARIVKIPRGKAAGQDDGDGEVVEGEQDRPSTGCSWDLAYALSVHKSQGSEWPMVVVMIDDYAGAKRVCSREWAYTALSRAKQKCVLIGKKSVADQYCRTPKLDKRKTFLKERVLIETAKREVASL